MTTLTCIVKWKKIAGLYKKRPRPNFQSRVLDVRSMWEDYVPVLFSDDRSDMTDIAYESEELGSRTQKLEVEKQQGQMKCPVGW